MKKVIAIVLSLVLMSVLFVGCSSSKKSENVIKIGIFEPASGSNGAGGKQETLGIRYANQVAPTVTLGDKTYTIELVEVDNQSDTSKAVSAAQSLVNSGVKIALGSYGSSVAIAGSDVFKNAGIPVVGCSCTNPQVTEGNTHYFRVCFIDPFQGTVMANFANSKGCQKAYVLYQLGDDYSAAFGKYFANAFKALGGEVVEENFQEGNNDFSAYIANAVNSGCDVIFSPTSTTDASLIINQAASAGIKMPIMAGDTWESSVILDAAKDTGLEIYLSTFFDEKDQSASNVAADFVKGFREFLNADAKNLKNNGDNDIVAAVSACGYDAYMVAVEAIKAAGSDDSAAINEALWNVDYNGVTGSVVFDENGDAKKNIAYIKQADPDNMAFSFLQTQTISD